MAISQENITKIFKISLFAVFFKYYPGERIAFGFMNGHGIQLFMRFVSGFRAAPLHVGNTCYLVGHNTLKEPIDRVKLDRKLWVVRQINILTNLWSVAVETSVMMQG